VQDKFEGYNEMNSFPFDLTAAPAKFDPTSPTRTGAGSDAIDENLFQLHLRPASSSASSRSSYDASTPASNHSSNSTTASTSAASGSSASSAMASDKAAKSHREEESDSDESQDASPHDVENSGAAGPADEAARGDDEEQDSRHSDDDEQASQDDGSASAAGDEKPSSPEVGQAAVVEHASEVTGELSATEDPSQGAQREPGVEQVKAPHAKTQTNPSDAVEGVPTAVGKSNENEESEAISASTTDEDGAKEKPELAVKVDDRAAGPRVAVAPARSAKDGEAQSGVTTSETTAAPDAAVAETPQHQTNGDAPRHDRRSRLQVQSSSAVTNQSAPPTDAQAATTPAEKVVVELTGDETSTGDSGNSAPVTSAESHHHATQASPPSADGEAAPAATSGGGRLSQQLVSHARQAGGDGPQLTEAHQTRLINRVARAFQSAGEGGGEIRLRLSPPELGSLRLEVKIHSGVLSAHIEADTPATRTLLLHNLHVLRERLEQQNIRVEQFDVDLSDRQPGNPPNDPRDAHGQQSPRPRELSSSAESDAGGNEISRPGNAAVGGNDQLNVIV